MYACLLKYLHKSRTSASLKKSIDGVNNFTLIPADVMKVIVPILHCPMGLVDKLITSFLDYVWQKVLLLQPEDDLVRKKLQDTGVQLASSIVLLQSKKAVYDESKTPENTDERFQIKKTSLWKTEQVQTKQ
jgi:hypothetical protein